MTSIGQACLLAAFALTGYSAFACVAGVRTGRAVLIRRGYLAGMLGVLALLAICAVLAHALLVKDFSFGYVAQYSSRLLPWYFSLSALWVGQAGSLLLWACLLGVLSLVGRFSSSTFGFLMAYLFFLTATMVFAADPAEPSIVRSADGSGLSPLLQHPAMLIHPPLVILGFAAWAIPCALSFAALLEGRLDRRWVEQVRPWALFAWAVLGAGILLGAHWSYEELGWGGYWAWDPVENGSLIPWLTGTAFLHTLMAWRFCGSFKKSCIALGIATFGLCNFSTFLTRSGIFSSLHAFSQSPIGWLFLGLMMALGITGLLLIVARQLQLTPDQGIVSSLSREAMVCISMVALLLLAGVAVLGTLLVAISPFVLGRRILVGPEFYNYVLMSTGLVLLAVMAPAPLLRWGSGPSKSQRRALIASIVLSSVGTALAFALGIGQSLALALVWLVFWALLALGLGLFLDVRHAQPGSFWRQLPKELLGRRRQYAGFVVHAGVFCLAIGVTASALGVERHEFDLAEGETLRWANHTIQFRRLIQHDHTDKLEVAADLRISPGRGEAFSLTPAQEFHKLQKHWTTEAAIYPTWSGDFYAILHNGDGQHAHFTFVLNPLMRFLWFGGWLMGLGVVLGLCPSKVFHPRTREMQPMGTASGLKWKARRGAASRSASLVER